MVIPEEVRQKILAFVDSVMPGECESVWLTGSRVRGDFRPDSDWDVVAFTHDYDRESEKLFLSNQTSPFKLCGGVIELICAHPDHWNNPRRYMTELRQSGIRLR